MTRRSIEATLYIRSTATAPAIRVSSLPPRDRADVPPLPATRPGDARAPLVTPRDSGAGRVSVRLGPLQLVAERNMEFDLLQAWLPVTNVPAEPNPLAELWVGQSSRRPSASGSGTNPSTSHGMNIVSNSGVEVISSGTSS